MEEPMSGKKRDRQGGQTAGSRREDLMQHLGGYECSCQGEDCWHDGPCQVVDLRCLQIDHKYGGGTKEMRWFGSNTNMVFYYTRHLDEAEINLQVLCANCNWVKKHRNKETCQNSCKLG